MGKRGLGRGLAALIAEASDDAATGAVEQIALARIEANPFQPRTLFDPIKLEELAASVREHGVLQPVLVRRIGADRYQLVAGERRFRAAERAGISTIPALVRECTEREQLEIAIVENVQREDIGVMESARAYRRMQDEFSMSQEAIAGRVGKSRSSIANTMRLLSLPEEVQQSIEIGEISEGHGRALMMAGTEDGILRALAAVKKGGLSVRDTERLARSAKSDRETPGKSSEPPVRVRLDRDPNISAAIEGLQSALGTKVGVRGDGGTGGTVEIEFYSQEDLMRIVDILLGEVPQ